MIARMDRLEIVCLRNDLQDIIRTLQQEGLLHVEEVPLEQEQLPNFLHRVDLDPEQTARAEALEELDRLLRECEPLLSVKPGYEDVVAAATRLPELHSDAFLDKARQWSQELRELARRRASLRDEIEVIVNYRQMLENVRPVLGSRQVSLGHGARAVVLQGDTAKLASQLEERLKTSIGPNVEFIHQRSGKRTAAGVILYQPDQDPQVGQVLQSLGIAPVDAPDQSLRGLSVDEVLKKIDTTLENRRKELADVQSRIEAFSKENGAALVAMQRTVGDKLAEVRVVDSFAQSRLVAVIQGWAPHDEVGVLEDSLMKKYPGKVSISRLPMDQVKRHEVPTLLRNSKWLRPFEVTLKLFKPPTYGTFDPSPLVGLFFIFFYGFIVGDVGYGIVIAGLIYLLRRKFRHNELVVQATTMGFYASATTIVFGFLYGEFFGDFGERVFHMHPIWLHRGGEGISVAVVTLLIAAIIIGTIHIYMSLVLGVWENFRLGHTHHAEEKLGSTLGLTAVLIALLTAVAILPLPSGLWFGIAALLLLVAVGLFVRAAKWFAPIHVLEIFSLVSNILSYARLMALGIAAVVLADLANKAGAALGVVGVILAIIIHFFNIALSMFSPTIHSLRLNYVESLSKFYSPEGKPYKPFKKEATW